MFSTTILFASVTEMMLQGKKAAGNQNISTKFLLNSYKCILAVVQV